MACRRSTLSAWACALVLEFEDFLRGLVKTIAGAGILDQVIVVNVREEGVRGVSRMNHHVHAARGIYSWPSAERKYGL